MTAIKRDTNTLTPVKREAVQRAHPRSYRDNPHQLGITVDDPTLERLKQYDMPVAAACRLTMSGYFEVMDEALRDSRITPLDLDDMRRIFGEKPTGDWTVLWSRALDAGNAKLAQFIRDLPPIQQRALHDYLTREVPPTKKGRAK